MIFRLLILFILVPLVELFLLVKLAQATSLLTTILIVIGTGFVGVLTARVQGWLVWQKIKLDLSHGGLPADGLIEGVVLLIAGTLLITPGLITDTVGFALLVPPWRRFVREWIKHSLLKMIASGQTGFFVVQNGTVNVEAKEINETPPDP